MDLGKTLQYSGYVLMVVSILLAIISGNLTFILTTTLLVTCWLVSLHFLFEASPQKFPRARSRILR